MQASTPTTYPASSLRVTASSSYISLPWPRSPLHLNSLHFSSRSLTDLGPLHRRPAQRSEEEGAMAERGSYVQVQHGGQYGAGQQQHGHGQMGEQMKGMLQEKAPSASQALTVATLFPLGGLLLVLSGLALAGTVVGLAVATPVFLLFSPVLVPAALTIGMAVTGFLASGALGLGGLSSLTVLANTARQAFQRTPDYVEEARQRMADAAAAAGHKTQQAGHAIQSRAEETRAGHTAGAGAGAGTRASS
uniref:Oleosin n=3 Tax=Hordeum vulgare TaxID=4513 RepID=A0A8I6XLI2_HORVV